MANEPPKSAVCSKPKSQLSTCYLAFGDPRLRANAIQSASRSQNKANDGERATNRASSGAPRSAKRRRVSDTKDGTVSTEEDSDSNLDSKPRRSGRARQQPNTFTQFSPQSTGAARANRASTKSRTSDAPLSMRSQHDTPFKKEPAPHMSEPLSRVADLPDAPVFRPSLEEWADPMAYIRSITPQCRAAGLCKIIPPESWSPPFCLDSRRFSFTTREQNLHELQAGTTFGESNKNYTLGQFQQLAEQFKQHFRRSSTGKFTATEIEKEYWSIVNAQSPAIQVEYGADLDSSTHGSGFEPLMIDGDTLKNDTQVYAQSIGWNLRALPLVRGSLLGLLKEHVTGVSTPWLYVGMLFSSFCWHTEDNYLYSINYLHCGAGKTWYSVGGDSVVQMEQAMKSHSPHLFHSQPNSQQQVLQMDPHVLHHYDVNPYHCVQHPGEFIVTFPAAYHCGFSHGFNVGEAVNFALDLWLPYGRLAMNHYRQLHRPSVFPFAELLIAMSRQAAENPCFDLDMFLLEFDAMLQSEKEGRTRALEYGVRKVEHVVLVDSSSASSSSANPADPASFRVACAICSGDCFLSHVTCSRCRSPAVCLHHIEYACQCENYDKVVLNYTYSIGELMQLRNNAAQRRHAINTTQNQSVANFSPSFKEQTLGSHPHSQVAAM